MKIKKENGLAGIDMVIAIIAIMLFSTLILSMTYTNVMEEIKLTKETLAMIHITEVFEKIGISNYSDVTEENRNNFISEEIRKRYDNIEFTVIEPFINSSQKENILKKIQITLSYKIDNKTYNCSMERMKVKE